MFTKSFLNSQAMKSPLLRGGISPSAGTVNKKTLAITLTLTSLVDAFSILVIYLLVNTSSSDFQVQLSHELQLPMATQTKPIKPAPVVKIVEGKYYLNQQPLSLNQLRAELKKMAESTSDEKQGSRIIIQADKSTPFTAINPLLLTSSQAGYHKLRFVVIQAKEGA